MSETPWRDYDKLYHLYHELGLEQSEIAERFGCSTQTVYRWMKKLDISASRDRFQVGDKVNDKDWLQEQYKKRELSIRKIAKKDSVSSDVVLDRLHEFDIQTRNKSEAAINRHGKYNVPCKFHEGHFYCFHKFRGVEKQIAIHRLVAVAEFGFDAVIDKEIHHKNSMKCDNRPENLEPLSVEEHRRLHAKERWDNGGF